MIIVQYLQRQYDIDTNWRRSTVLSLPLQLVFHASDLIEGAGNFMKMGKLKFGGNLGSISKNYFGVKLLTLLGKLDHFITICNICFIAMNSSRL